MKLVYHTGNNFGDALNPLVFTHFLGPDILKDSSELELLGIGTILGLKQSSLPKVVFSSGVSSNEATYGPMPTVDKRYDIRAVRGPLTAKALNLSSSTAVTDGAVLVREVLPRTRESILGKIGFIPHHKSLSFYSQWKDISRKAGLTFLDVRQNPERFIDQLWECEAVVTEAMHGAIVADAYGIPWIPIKLYAHIDDFKWIDWSASVAVAMQFHCSRAQLHRSDFLIRLMIKRGLHKALAQALSPILMQWRERKTVFWLKRVSQAQPYLSDRTHLYHLIEELKMRLEHIKSDYIIARVNGYDKD